MSSQLPREEAGDRAGVDRGQPAEDVGRPPGTSALRLQLGWGAEAGEPVTWA